MEGVLGFSYELESFSGLREFGGLFNGLEHGNEFLILYVVEYPHTDSFV